MELEFIKGVVLVIMAGFIYLIKRELNTKDHDVEKLKEEVQHIRANYLHRDDFKDFKLELKSMFEEIRKDIRALNGKTND